jgi:hypothetical protein
MLTASYSLMKGYAFTFIAILHSITVIATFIWLPFGKFFHIFQRPDTLRSAVLGHGLSARHVHGMHDPASAGDTPRLLARHPAHVHPRGPGRLGRHVSDHAMVFRKAVAECGALRAPVAAQMQ